MLAGQPVVILKEGTKRETGKDAMKNNIEAARTLAASVKSTLGPKGMDKMLVDSMGDVVITNDGVTILKEIDIEHPAAKMLVEVAKTQDSEVGDGTTTAVIIAGELLNRAEGLITQNVHPTVIASGYRLAAEKAKQILDDISDPISPKDEDILKKAANTSLSSKSAGSAKELLSEISVRAVKSIVEERDGRSIVDMDNIQIVKKQGAAIDATELINGIVIDKEKVHAGMPDTVKDAKIALINSALEIKKPEFDANIQIKDPSMMHQFLDEEENILKGMVDKIKESGANVIFCQKGIDDLAQHYLAKYGIYAVRRVKKSDMEKLSKATGAKIITNLEDLSSDDLGVAESVEQRKIGDDNMTFVRGCKNPKAVTILIRGGTEHVVEEVERSLQDSLHVVASALEVGNVVPGGGATAVEIAMRLKEYAASVGGREQLAIEAFADSLEVIPRTLAENAGLDPIDILIQLRKRHNDGEKYAGINMFTGKIENMKELGVIEPVKVGRQAIDSASEAAVMILRIDDVIASKGNTGDAKGGNTPDFDSGGF